MRSHRCALERCGFTWPDGIPFIPKAHGPSRVDYWRARETKGCSPEKEKEKELVIETKAKVKPESVETYGTACQYIEWLNQESWLERNGGKDGWELNRTILDFAGKRRKYENGVRSLILRAKIDPVSGIQWDSTNHENQRPLPQSDGVCYYEEFQVEGKTLALHLSRLEIHISTWNKTINFNKKHGGKLGKRDLDFYDNYICDKVELLEKWGWGARVPEICQ